MMPDDFAMAFTHGLRRRAFSRCLVYYNFISRSARFTYRKSVDTKLSYRRAAARDDEPAEILVEPAMAGCFTRAAPLALSSALLSAMTCMMRATCEPSLAPPPLQKCHDTMMYIDISIIYSQAAHTPTPPTKMLRNIRLEVLIMILCKCLARAFSMFLPRLFCKSRPQKGAGIITAGISISNFYSDYRDLR